MHSPPPCRRCHTFRPLCRSSTPSISISSGSGSCSPISCEPAESWRWGGVAGNDGAAGDPRGVPLRPDIATRQHSVPCHCCPATGRRGRRRRPGGRRRPATRWTRSCRRRQRQRSAAPRPSSAPFASRAAVCPSSCRVRSRGKSEAMTSTSGPPAAGHAALSRAGTCSWPSV